MYSVSREAIGERVKVLREVQQMIQEQIDKTSQTCQEMTDPILQVDPLLAVQEELRNLIEVSLIAYSQA